MGVLSSLAATPQSSRSSDKFSQKHTRGFGVADLHWLESEGMVAALVGGRRNAAQCFDGAHFHAIAGKYEYKERPIPLPIIL